MGQQDVAELSAVCRVHGLLPDRGNGVTAIDKRPVTRSVRVNSLGLFGDVQADRRHHGGEDAAVYAYADEDAEAFVRELDRPIPAGLFGENLRTSGADVSGALIGERWQVGERVLLEVTAPRTPCGTFERRMGIPGWIDRFTAMGAPGAYFRVLRAGDVRAGDPIAVVSRPSHGVTIGGWFSSKSPSDARALLDADAAGDIRLADDLRRHATRALEKVAG